MGNLSMRRARLSKLRDLFLAQDGKCVWCGCDMELSSGAQLKGHANRATFDHFYSVLTKTTSRQPKVGYAACHGCNSARGVFDQLLHLRGINVVDSWLEPSQRKGEA